MIFNYKSFLHDPEKMIPSPGTGRKPLKYLPAESRAEPMTRQVVATPETLQRPRLQRLLRYWQEKRGGRAMPAREDLDPLDMPWMLGDLSLVEVHREAQREEHGNLRYRFRLVGSRVVERLGYDMTGKWLDALPGPDYRAYLVEAFGEVVTRATPLSEQPNMVIDHSVHHYEILRLPLAADGHRPDMLMLAVDFNEA